MGAICLRFSRDSSSENPIPLSRVPTYCPRLNSSSDTVATDCSLSSLKSSRALEKASSHDERNPRSYFSINKTSPIKSFTHLINRFSTLSVSTTSELTNVIFTCEHSIVKPLVRRAGFESYRLGTAFVSYSSPLRFDSVRFTQALRL